MNAQLKNFKMSINSGVYWQDRVKTLSTAAVNIKMQASGMVEGPARAAMSTWICNECKIEKFSPTLLTIAECKRVVALLHRTRIGDKIRG